MLIDINHPLVKRYQGRGLTLAQFFKENPKVEGIIYSAGLYMIGRGCRTCGNVYYRQTIPGQYVCRQCDTPYR